MQKLSVIAGILLCLSAGHIGIKPGGTWRWNLLALNGDTIFLATDSSYSLRDNLKTQGLSLRTAEDSIVVTTRSLERFHQNRQSMIHFLEDSSITMTKVRSGGQVYVDEQDSGKYELRHDTVVFTIRTRRDYQFALVYDPVRDILHWTDGIPGHMVYMEYVRVP